MIDVSIVCAAFNQAGYIRDALEGFIKQDTGFSYEVIVNDDCSTDGTTDIIREYAERYPQLIIPIFHTHNHRGKINGIGVVRYIVNNIARGRYIALCEGDDYWIDRHKLQIQYDWLEHNPEYSICSHNALVADQVFDVVYLSEPDTGDRDKGFGQLVVEGGGLINPTASLFFRKECYDEWRPGPVGDHFILMALSRHGKLRWFSRPMSVYRFKSKGSWSNSADHYDVSAIRAYHDKYVDALAWMDESSGRVEHQAFARRIALQDAALDERSAMERFRTGEIGLLDLAKAAGCREAFKSVVQKRFPRLYEPLGRMELIASTKRQRRFVSDHIEGCDQAKPL